MLSRDFQAGLNSRQLAHCWAVAWAANASLWFLLVGKATAQEFVAGAAAASAACLGILAFYRRDRLPFGPSAAMIMLARRVPSKILSDAWAVGLGLVRRASGRHQRVAVKAAAFKHGGEDSRSVARRTLAIAYTTMASNTIVLGFVPDEGLMLYHDFVPADEPELARRLRALP